MHNRERLVFGAALALTFTVQVAQAQVPMSGSFVAEASCFATPSIRSDNNPGRIVTQPGRSYELLGRNAMPGSHYLIRIPEAEPKRRWVAYGCGRVGDTSSSASRGAAPDVRKASDADSFVLAASWHAAFCETRPRRADCRDGGRVSAGFSLHGLWPQPRGREYCGVSASIRAADEAGRWGDLPAVELKATTRAALQRVMPGMASNLDRHEYWTHGTCYAGGAEAYFVQSIRLIEELNASSVANLFTDSTGDELTGVEIRRAFDQAFGRGTGQRVLIDCESDRAGRRLIGELRIALKGDPDRGDTLAQMIAAAEPSEPGCRGGRVDAPGSG